MIETVAEVKIQNFFLGARESLTLFAGPCVIESEEHTLQMAEKLSKLTRDININFVFKSSYDKANRSSISSYRGPGIDRGLEILNKVKLNFSVPIISDVHSVEEVQKAAKVLDVIQIPALLSRQTDLVVAAAESGKVINVKCGQFSSPAEVSNIVSKIISTNNRNVILTYRGFTFGYNNLVADMRALPIFRENGFPVVFDATHCVQNPGGLGKESGGDSSMVEYLARAAAAVGVDGFFMETHDNVHAALSDASNMIPLDKLDKLLRDIIRIDAIVKENK